MTRNTEWFAKCGGGVLCHYLTGVSGHADRYHVLSALGETWCNGEPRFPDALAADYTQHVMSKGGVVTWDVPIQQNGLIPPAFVKQLTHIGTACR